MSQTTVDLPKAPPETAIHDKADEMISQMAGEEVDRLLASAEIDRSRSDASDATPSAEAVAAPQVLAPQSASVEPQGLRGISSPAGPLAAAESSDGFLSDEALLAAEIDARLAVTAAPTTREPAASPANAAPIEPLAAVSLARAGDVASNSGAADAPPPAVDSLTVVDSKSVDGAPTAVPQSAEPATSSAATPVPAAAELIENILPDEPRLSIFLRPLALLNRPFGFISDAVRDAIGKIALLTSLNAAALLVYVFWFKQR